MKRLNKALKLQDSSMVNGYFLIFMLLFIGSVVFRMVAASNLPLNAFESALLMESPGHSAAWENPISIIESLFIKTTFLIFGKTQIGARIWPALAGSILVLVPFYLKATLGKKLGLVLGVLLAIEPFLLVNSLQVGSNIFAILGLALVFAALVREDNYLIKAGIIILLLSGRGLLPSMIIIGVLCLYHKNIHALDVIQFKNIKLKVIGHDSRIMFASSFVFAALAFSFLKIDLSALIASISAYFPQTINPYFRYAANTGLPVVLFSYAPLFILIFALFCFNFRTQTKTLVSALLIAVIALSIWIVIMPHKSYLDLVWVMLPMLIGCAYYLSELSLKDLNSIRLVMFLIAIILMISLIASLSQFISQGRYGISQLNAIINVITILLLIIFFFFAFFGFGSGRLFFRVAGRSLLVVGLVMQITFAIRAVGLTRDISQELLWSGAIADADILMRTLNLLDITKQDVKNEVQIGVEEGLSPQLIWILKGNNTYFFPAGASGPMPLDVVLTQANEIQIRGKFVGQPVVADAYPKWTETPLKSLFDYDYWSWLIFRNSDIEKVTHHIWYAME